MQITTAEIAARGLILRGSVGSTAHGLHLAGTDDRDEMGIAVEPPDRVIGLTDFEQHIHRTAEERLRHNPSADQRSHGRTPPSRAGDLDLTVYSLRKYTRLAANGNPTVQILLLSSHSSRTDSAGGCGEMLTSLPARRQARDFSATCERSVSGCSVSAGRCV